jgi:hypothetical protein
VKLQFISDIRVPSAIIEVRSLPRVGEVLHIGTHQKVEVLEVIPTETDKRYSAVIKGKPLQ